MPCKTGPGGRFFRLQKARQSPCGWYVRRLGRTVAQALGPPDRQGLPSRSLYAPQPSIAGQSLQMGNGGSGANGTH
jgi:hypothetical protein